VVRGDAEAVRRHAEEALSLHRRTRLPWTALLADASLACSFALRGDTVAANAAIDDIFVPGHVFDDPSAFEPIFWPNRRIIEAYAGLRVHLGDEPPGFSPPPGPGEAFDYSTLTTFSFQVELADFAGRPQFAAPVEPVLAFAEERGVLLTFGWPLLLPRVRGIAAMLAGRSSEAEGHLRRAVGVAERLEALPELARSQLDLARLLTPDASASRRTETAELLHRAARGFESIGMAGFLERTRRLAAELGIGLA